jgi:hypothetical protein
MKASFYFYKGKLQALPKALFFIIILFVIILIPALIAIGIVTTAAAFFLKGAFRILIPKRSPKIEYTDFEIIEDTQEKKRIDN